MERVFIRRYGNGLGVSLLRALKRLEVDWDEGDCLGVEKEGRKLVIRKVGTLKYKKEG